MSQPLAYPPSPRPSGAVQTAQVLTHRFVMGETEEALTLARREPASLKPLVIP